MKIKEKQIQNRCQEVFLLLFLLLFFSLQRIINVQNSLPGKIVKAETERSLNKQLDCKQLAKTSRCSESNGLCLFLRVQMFLDNIKCLGLPQTLNFQAEQREFADILGSVFLRFKCELVECRFGDFHFGNLPFEHMCFRRNVCEDIKIQESRDAARMNTG